MEAKSHEPSLLPSITPERWPWVVLTVGGIGVLVRTIGAFQPIFRTFRDGDRIPWNPFVFTFLGQAAFDFATVLALFYLVRILVERVWFRG